MHYGAEALHCWVNAETKEALPPLQKVGSGVLADASITYCQFKRSPTSSSSGHQSHSHPAHPTSRRSGQRRTLCI